jgi:methane/ammonia monooxygenase subunit C
VGFVVLFVALSLYLHAFGWYAGIDASSTEFALYWRSLLIFELVSWAVGTLAWWTWLLRTGRELARTVGHAEEVRRIVVVWGLASATCVVLYFMTSFFPISDAAWHQTAVRDTAFTPTHIVMFYAAYPLGITMAVGTYLYGRTRLPKLYGPAKGFPWSFFLLIAASVAEMMQVAMNEWGHSLWITEEIFAAPFHWPFVMYGWLAVSIFTIWTETGLRVIAIENEADAAENAASAAQRSAQAS